MADEDQNNSTVSTESIDNKPPVQNTETVIQDGQTGQTKVVDTSGEVPAGAGDATADVPQPEPSTEAKQWASAPGSNDAAVDPVQVDPPPVSGGEQDTGKSDKDGNPIVSAPPADMTVSQSAASVAQVEASKADDSVPTLSPIPDIIVPSNDLTDDEKNDLVMPLFETRRRVRALKIAKVHYHVIAFEDQRFMARTMRDFVEKHNPSSGGWYVVHNDGTEDYYPSDFENDFQPI